MSEQETAGQARKGLIDSIKGRAKEIVGAMTGNDSLTTEGQLDQIQAQQRKEANAVEAVADAEAAQARTQAAHAHGEGAKERIALNADRAAAETSVREHGAAHKREAEQDAQQEAARAKTRAELDAQRRVQRAKAQGQDEISAAAGKAVDAAAEHQSSVQAATAAHNEAARLRQQADKLSNQADLP